MTGLRAPRTRTKRGKRGILLKEGGWHDARGSARGGRLNLPTCAHLYIYIYIRLTSIPTLFFIPLSSGVLLLAAAGGGGICGGGSGGGGGGSDDGGSGDDGNGSGGGARDAGGCAFFRECSPSALIDRSVSIRRIPLTHPLLQTVVI